MGLIVSVFKLGQLSETALKRVYVRRGFMKLVLAIISAVQLGVNHSQDVSIALYAATLVFTVVAAFFLVATGRSGRSSLAVMALVWIVVRAGLVFIGIGLHAKSVKNASSTEKHVAFVLLVLQVIFTTAYILFGFLGWRRFVELQRSPEKSDRDTAGDSLLSGNTLPPPRAYPTAPPALP